MKLGLSIEPIKGFSFNKLLSLLKIVGIEHFEVSVSMIPFFDKIIPSLSKITTTMHLPIYDRNCFDLGSNDPLYDIQISEIITAINNNYQAMNMLYTLSHPPEGPNSTVSTLIERLEQIKTPIILENIINQTEEDFLDFYFQVKDHLGKKLVGHALDAPHRYVRNNHTWLNIPKDLIKEIVYVHISDCTRTQDSHKPLGLGELPYEYLFDFLKNINFQGIINQEIKPHPTEIIDLLYSCNRCVQPFSKRKAIKMKTLLGLIKPFIQWQINLKFGSYKDLTIDKVANELIL
ncbi:MAG: sugar phosphate isomerase/epimerase [Candidatus Heimdallarchaeota archaeon]|nr:sugar phosphate isomerase/epimerase [Candidatus Heimdallarchaeota archaeon]